jgi:hypothetical protein
MLPLQKQKNKLYVALFAIFLFGAFLRLYHLSLTPYWMDEGYTVNAVDSQVRNGTRDFASILDSGESYFCPLYCAPTAEIVKIVGHDPASYRILSVLFGLLFIPLVYFFTWSLFQNILVSSFSTIFTALSYWQIAWSRQARWYTMTEFFFWGTLWLFYLFLKETRRRQKYIYLGASIATTLLSIVTHRIAYLLPVVCLIWFFLEKRPSKKNIAIAGASTLAILLFAEFGLGLHFISHALKNVELHYTLPYYLNFYLRNYWMFLFLAVYGYFNIQKSETKKKFWMIATPFLLYLFFLSFFTNIVHYRYLFHTSVAIYILASIAMSNILVHVKNVKKNKMIIFTVIVLFFISGQGVSWAKDFYLLEADNPSSLNRPYYAYTPQPDFNAAYNAIKSDRKTDDIVISSHPHFNKIFLNKAEYWLRYDYLGMEDTNKIITNNREYYVGASVVNSLEELRQVTSAHHGYILYDYMAADGKIPAETIEYIQRNFKLFFFDEKNEYSKVWVYRF